MPEYQIERRTGERYSVTVKPGQLITLRPDESLIVPEPPRMSVAITLATLHGLEARLDELERKVDNLLTLEQGRVWDTSLATEETQR